MNEPTTQKTPAVQWFEAVVYLASTVAVIAFTVEEWRLRRAWNRLRDVIDKTPEHVERIPTPQEITAMHREARAITADHLNRLTGKD